MTYDESLLRGFTLATNKIDWDPAILAHVRHDGSGYYSIQPFFLAVLWRLLRSEEREMDSLYVCLLVEKESQLPPEAMYCKDPLTVMMP